MSFLQRFIGSSYRDAPLVDDHSSFAEVSDVQLEEHLQVARYGSFLLTDAVRPAFNLEVVPSAGYRRDVYQDKHSGIDVPVLMAAETREKLFDLFLDLLDPLGESVDVVLESSHSKPDQSRHSELYREAIELPILKSTLYDFEDLLLNDGCTGIAVLNPRAPLEVQFDEHKLLVMYGQDLMPFEEVLDDAQLRCSDDIRFLTEAEHVHSTTVDYQERFEELQWRLGIDV